ncbi:MAG: AAA family ATPase [Ruminococcus sp.]|uniref:AAA family ATPase n=1 Tax=Ruminococcus sp. TaxID=41978 RepID=UPI0025D6D660|nr:ATP-binding protein [Ruminococcus sp.]MBO4867408.1 AAA family ATPase [Ruminococcus sp.]
MLKRFEVKGFKNFKDTLTIDFTDVRDYKFNKECITDDLIGKMIVYGKNSVGKSNLGLAVFDVVTHLFSRKVNSDLYTYYLNSETDISEADFKYTFQFGDNEVWYHYKKNEKQELLYEEVVVNGDMFFRYDLTDGEGDYGDAFKEVAGSLKFKNLNVESVLSYVSNNVPLEFDHPLSMLLSYVNSMLWFNCSDEDFIGYKFKRTDYYDFLKDNTLRNEFQEFLHDAGVKENLDIKKEPDGTMALYFDTATPMPFFKVASSGTKALYTFFYWYKTAKNVSLLFIDEFDAFYHYELAESIVKLLEKMPKTQVILTSHNTNLLTNRIMRPDCYFILSDNRLTSFANATNRELREGHNLEKLYKSGEFDG